MRRQRRCNFNRSCNPSRNRRYSNKLSWCSSRNNNSKQQQNCSSSSNNSKNNNNSSNNDNNNSNNNNKNKKRRQGEFQKAVWRVCGSCFRVLRKVWRFSRKEIRRCYKEKPLGK